MKVILDFKNVFNVLMKLEKVHLTMTGIYFLQRSQKTNINLSYFFLNKFTDM